MSFDNAPSKRKPSKAWFEAKEREAVKRERERLGVDELENRIIQLEVELEHKNKLLNTESKALSMVCKKFEESHKENSELKAELKTLKLWDSIDKRLDWQTIPTKELNALKEEAAENWYQAQDLAKENAKLREVVKAAGPVVDALALGGLISKEVVNALINALNKINE